MIPVGTIINVLAVATGSLLGILLRQKFPIKIKAIIFQGIGLSILVVGFQMALRVEDLLLLIFSILVGGIIGEIINLEKRIENIGNFLKSKLNLKMTNLLKG